jgi:hypothetical protein
MIETIYTGFGGELDTRGTHTVASCHWCQSPCPSPSETRRAAPNHSGSRSADPRVLHVEHVRALRAAEHDRQEVARRVAYDGEHERPVGVHRTVGHIDEPHIGLMGW